MKTILNKIGLNNKVELYNIIYDARNHGLRYEVDGQAFKLTRNDNTELLCTKEDLDNIGAEALIKDFKNIENIYYFFIENTENYYEVELTQEEYEKVIKFIKFSNILIDYNLDLKEVLELLSD